MRLFRRRLDQADAPWWAQPVPAPEPEPEDPDQIRVARTLVMSEPELSALLDSDPRLQGEGLEVKLVEKGFGTRVAISATPGSGLAEADLETLLDDLAQPQKRPFSAS